MRYFLVAMTLALVACARDQGPTDPSAVVPATTEREVYILNETSKYAGLLDVKVVGVISTYQYKVECQGIQGACNAFGWYNRGVAYYWREAVNDEQYSTQTLTFVAQHEVCHAVDITHGSRHQACVEGLATR